MIPSSLDVPFEQLFSIQLFSFDPLFRSKQTAYMRMQLVYIDENARGEFLISSTQKQETAYMRMQVVYINENAREEFPISSTQKQEQLV